MSDLPNPLHGFRSDQPLSPSEQHALDKYRALQSVAEVHVKVFGLDKGQSEVGISISPTGALASQCATDAGRSAIFMQLLACLQRELQDALTALAG